MSPKKHKNTFRLTKVHSPNLPTPIFHPFPKVYVNKSRETELGQPNR